MYDKEQTKNLQQKTADWLLTINKENAATVSLQSIEDLRTILRFHEYR